MSTSGTSGWESKASARQARRGEGVSERSVTIQRPGTGRPALARPRRHRLRTALIVMGITLAVVTVVGGLAVVAAFVLVVTAMNSYGSNK
jgi:hypothetical protein